MTAAFRLTAPEPPERDLQASLVDVLAKLLLPPAFFFSAAIGATRLTEQQAAALTRAGVKRGIPDLLLLHAGKLHGLELKTRKGRLSKTRVVHTRRGSPRILEGQEDVFPQLRAAGMEIAIVRTVDEALAAVRGWQIPLRGRFQ